jgi:hypothetical protein
MLYTTVPPRSANGARSDRSVEIEMKAKGRWRSRFKRIRIRSRYEVALAIPDLETVGSLDLDPRKVAQR